MYRLVVWGSPLMTVEILKNISHVFEISTIISTPDAPVGRTKILTPTPVSEYAIRNRIPLYRFSSLKSSETYQILRDISEQSDIWIVIAYGKIIPQSILDIMPNKILNIHPSLLPQYRGPSPIQASLRNGDTKTGVSLMIIDNQMDHGPILNQLSIDISPDETYTSLEKKIITYSSQLLIDTIPRFMEQNVKLQPQDDTKASYVSFIQKSDGHIDWTQHSAKDIYQMWQAYSHWPKVWSYLSSGKRIIFHTLQISNKKLSSPQMNPGSWKYQDGCILIQTIAGIIAVTQVSVEGKSLISSQEFAQGYSSVHFV